MDKLAEIDRGYPRPTIPCNKCSTDLILCWGLVRKPYLRHKSSSSCKGGEGVVHSLAKIMLLEYLEQGGSVNYQSGIVPHSLRWKVEAKHNECIYDLLGFDGDNPIFGIEIYHTHLTTNTLPRILDWIEVDAYDVLDKIDLDKVPPSIFLKDISKQNEHIDPVSVIRDKPIFFCKSCDDKVKTEDAVCSKCVEEAKREDDLRRVEGYLRCTKCYLHLVPASRRHRSDLCDKCGGALSIPESKIHCNEMCSTEDRLFCQVSPGKFYCNEVVITKKLIYHCNSDYKLSLLRPCATCKKPAILESAPDTIKDCLQCTTKKKYGNRVNTHRQCKACNKLDIRKTSKTSVIYCNNCLYASCHNKLKKKDGFRECVRCQVTAIYPKAPRYIKLCFCCERL